MKSYKSLFNLFLKEGHLKYLNLSGWRVVKPGMPGQKLNFGILYVFLISVFQPFLVHGKF